MLLQMPNAIENGIYSEKSNFSQRIASPSCNYSSQVNYTEL